MVLRFLYSDNEATDEARIQNILRKYNLKRLKDIDTTTITSTYCAKYCLGLGMWIIPPFYATCLATCMIAKGRV